MIRFGALIATLLTAGAVSAAEPTFKAQGLPASGLKAGDQFGSAVAVGDGVIAVGAYLADGGRGAVYLFTRVGNGWGEKLPRLSGGPGEWFGFDLAFDTTGKTLIIGAPSPGKVGKVYIHDDRGLQPPVTWGAAGDEFGSSVSTDEGWVAVGARGAGQRTGRVYVFELSDRLPIPLAIELPGPSAGAELGQSVSLRGEMLAAGAPLPGKDGKSPGAVYISTRKHDTWGPLELIPGPGLNARSAFGYAVAVQKGRVVVGAPLASPGGAVYTCEGLSCELYLQGGKDDQMGVAVAADGDWIVTGARGADGNKGAVYRNKERLPREGVKGPELGFGVAVRGETIVAGAFREGGTGAAYVFEPETPPCEPQIELTSPAGPLTTSESGASLKFTVKLTCKPASPVPVTISDPGEAKVEPKSLLSDGEVTVTGEDDLECDGPQAYSLQIGPLTIALTNLDDDVCLGATQEVCITPDDVAVFEVTVRNLAAVRLEQGTYLVDLPDDVRVVAATAERGVVTVDHLANTVAWNGSLPVGGEALIRIFAPLEPGAPLVYDACE
jgi:hypothetical protein